MHDGLLLALGLLTAGTFLMRIAGPLLVGRFTLDARVERLLADAAVLLLCALAVCLTFIEGSGFAGWARLAGVLTGGLMAWFRVPLPLVVIAAGAVCALLRALGVS